MSIRTIKRSRRSKVLTRNWWWAQNMGEGKQKRNLRKAIVSEAIGRISLGMFSEMNGIFFISGGFMEVFPLSQIIQQRSHDFQ